MHEGPLALGKYQLIAEIARGGMGVVYLALVQGPGGFNKLVVIKELKADLVEDPTFLTMFQDEARLAARLSHPNIVQTNEVGNEGERHFIAMEYLDGRTYERVRRRSKNAGTDPLTLAMQVKILCDVLVALEYAHDLADFDGRPLKVVHRDISPNNVFVTFDGYVKVLDFGIAKAADHDHHTMAGAIKGKLSYMAPEQARGHAVDARADLFSVGVMLWEAAVGKRLRTNVNDELVKMLSGEEVPRASTANPAIAPELDDIIAKAMSNDREQRYGTAAEMHAVLEKYLVSIGGGPSAKVLGQTAANLFGDERTKVNYMIEQAVTRARTGAKAEADLPVIELSGIAPNAHTPTPRPTERSTSTISTVTSVSDVAPVTASLAPTPTVAGEQPEHTGKPPVHPAAPPSRRGKLLAVAGVAVVGIAAVAFALGRGGSKIEPATTLPPPVTGEVARGTDPTPVAPPTTNPLPSEPAAIGLEVVAQPANASIEIDGAAVSGNPFRGRYVKDGLMHRIRVTAPGHEPETRSIAFDADQRLELALDRTRAADARPRPRTPQRTNKPTPTAQPTAPPPPATPTATPPTTPSSPTINPQGGQKPTRPIDSKNPYGN